MRGLVRPQEEAAFFAAGADGVQGFVRAVQDEGVRQAQHVPTFADQVGIAGGVAQPPLVAPVLIAVALDDEAEADAGEVGVVQADGNLAAELPAELLSPDAGSELDLGRRHGATLSASESIRTTGHAEHLTQRLSTVPPPAGGQGTCGTPVP